MMDFYKIRELVNDHDMFTEHLTKARKALDIVREQESPNMCNSIGLLLNASCPLCLYVNDTIIFTAIEAHIADLEAKIAATEAALRAAAADTEG
ncbi:MAG: hypothetical protein ABIH23_04955 [bacterium]